MKLKEWQNICHMILKENSMLQHVIQIKNKIVKHVNVNTKFIAHAKKIIVQTLAHVFVRIISI